MSGRGPAAVLLDMDGVQVDSEPCHERSFHLWVERRGVELPPDVDPEQFRGLDDRSIFEGLTAICAGGVAARVAATTLSPMRIARTTSRRIL